MLGKLLGKKNKYYLELKDDNSSITEKIESVATQLKQDTQEIVQDAKQAIAESSVIQEIKSETKEKVGEVQEKVTEILPQAKKAAAKSSKKASKKTTEVASEAKALSSPQPTNNSYSEEPFWVKLMYKTNEQQATEQNSEKTFATNYLISPPQPRRRPGGSLAPFKAMARQTKTKF